MQNIMTQMGFQTLSAYGVAEALATVDRTPPDLVLLDVTLPDGCGFDLCRDLQTRAGDSQTPVIFISSHEDTTTKVRGFESGGVDYITKPIARAELAARVSTHLRLKYAFESLAQLQAERIQRLSTVQESMMPKPAEMPEARFQVLVHQIHKAGGDFYDVIAAGSDLVDYLVADVSGHDLASSYWTSALKTLLAEYATPANSPREILHAMNRILCRVLPEGVFFTALYARLNRRTHRLSLVNAGHPPAILASAADSRSTLLGGDGDVMGAFPDATFDAVEQVVKAGDRLVLYSDGLVELDGPRDTGVARLRELVSGTLRESLADAVGKIHERMTEQRVVQDDVLLMGVDL